MSPEGLRFMQGLLERGEGGRMAADEALAHPWLREQGLSAEDYLAQSFAAEPEYAERSWMWHRD